MEVLMILDEENEHEAVYHFTITGKANRGIMRISKDDPDSSVIEKYPDEDSITIRISTGAIVKLIRQAREGRYPQREGYCPGW